MSGDGVIYHAVLIFNGDRHFDNASMRHDIGAAYRVTGEGTQGIGASDDLQAVHGTTVCTRFDVFAPAERGGTVPADEVAPGLEVFAEAYPDLAAPAALVSIQIFALTPGADEPRLSAVLAQVVDLLVARTDADFVRLPGHAGLMTGARFRSEFRLAQGHLPETGATENGPPDARRGCASRREEAHVAGARTGIDVFPDIDLVAPELDRAWQRTRPGGELRDTTLKATRAGKPMPIEARLATWTVNAAVAILAPPVGASLAVYNLMRGEDFRLSAHALALTGTFLALGASGMMPSLAGLL